MAMSRQKMQGRKESGTFAKIPSNVLSSEEYAALSMKACKLLLDLCGQYNGYNNGKFTLTWSLMSRRGWKSQETLDNARRELLRAGFTATTRKGNRGRISMYAVTFLPIDWVDKERNADLSATTRAPNLWKKPQLQPKKSAVTTAVVKAR